MQNSWCKLENGVIVNGPRAWDNNTPPDETWVPHRLEDPAHTINDKFLGSTFSIIGNEVIETNNYEPKTSEEIQLEINGIKDFANKMISFADKKIETVSNKQDWIIYKNELQTILAITVLDHIDWPLQPKSE